MSRIRAFDDTFGHLLFLACVFLGVVYACMVLLMLATIWREWHERRHPRQAPMPPPPPIQRIYSDDGQTFVDLGLGLARRRQHRG